MKSTLNTDDVRTNLVDTIADLAHVIRAEGIDGAPVDLDDLRALDFALQLELGNALARGLEHFRVEAGDGPEAREYSISDGHGNPVVPPATI